MLELRIGERGVGVIVKVGVKVDTCGGWGDEGGWGIFKKRLVQKENETKVSRRVIKSSIRSLLESSILKF